MMLGLGARISSRSMCSLVRTLGSLLVRKTSAVAMSLWRMSSPSGEVRSRPRLCLPRLECSSSTWTSVGHHRQAARRQAAHGVAALDVLDLDDLGAPGGEQGRRGRHERVLGDLEDADAFQDCGHELQPLHGMRTLFPLALVQSPICAEASNL